MVLRLPFGLQLDMQPYPPFSLIKFLFVGLKDLRHHFLHPIITDFSLWLATLGGNYLRLDFHQLDKCHAWHT
ncbi:hypothetical protein, partial [Tetragenococcus muriaticus]|uniref:hypothetical protein n=1 Tax=Tetragenococcus muriaticus TaxID=64642 RepID=UPI001E4CA25B